MSTAKTKIKSWFSKAIIVVAVLLYVFGIALIYAETYYSSAILVSTNLLSGLTINSVDYFGYNCSILANTTLKVQFSQDGDSWYSASHVADTWTDLSDGSHLDSGSGAIALSGFDIDTPNPEFYYKIQLSTSDTATTPNFISVNLIYNTGSYATATTQAASGVLALTATGNGNITGAGSSTITKRGFQYGISQTANLREVSETGTFGTGAFSLELTYLYAGKTHYVRSFAQNSEGRAYGDWQEFTALDNYYYSSAVGVSSNLLSGQTVNSINGFFATTSIPSGTGITAQFSQDNSSWYSAGGTLDGTTSLSNGENQIDLTGLGWSGANFYYKVALSADSGRLETPVLQSVYLNYNVPIESSGPSDSGSSASNPTLSGSDIDFSITATDSESDNYYLAVCKTNSITANNEAVPTCGGGNWCISDSTVSASQASCSYTTSGTDEGDNSWYAFVCDHNAESACSVAMQGTGDNGSPFSVYIDSTAPTTTADAGSYVFGNWSKENVEVSLSCDDGSGSGCATTKYCTDTDNTCTPTTDYTTAVTISTEGTSYIRYLSTDNATNEETAKSSTVKVDKTAPTTTADAGSYVFGETSTSAITVTLVCSDGSGSGCLSTLYCTDTDNTCTPATSYTTAVTISTEGTSYIRYLSTDNATNEETANSETIVIQTSTSTPSTGGGSMWLPIGQQEAEDNNKQEDDKKPALEIDKNIILQIGQQLKDMADGAMEFFFGKQQTAVSEITIPEETPEAFENIEIMGELPAESLEISFIGDNISFFSGKLPDFSQTMQDLGINDLNNLRELGGAEFILPGIASFVGVEVGDVEVGLNIPVVSIANMNREEKDKIPTDIIFARTAAESIEHNMAISVSDSGDVEQRISLIASQKVELIIKPQNTAKRITGIVILKNKPEAKLNPFSDLWRYFSAALSGYNTDEENLETYGLLLDKFEYFYEGDGIYKAEFKAPVNEGEYEIITIIEYEESSLRSKGIKLIAAVDPEGYIFRKLPQGELRVRDALVSIYWLNSETGEYELWPAKKYFQENPQTTDDTGRYVFLVPEGIYYLKVEAKGYHTYEGSPFSVVKDIGVHKNIELKKKAEWKEWLDWKIWIIIILGIVIALIVYKYIKNLISKNGTEKNI